MSVIPIKHDQQEDAHFACELQYDQQHQLYYQEPVEVPEQIEQRFTQHGVQQKQTAEQLHGLQQQQEEQYLPQEHSSATSEQLQQYLANHEDQDYAQNQARLHQQHQLQMEFERERAAHLAAKEAEERALEEQRIREEEEAQQQQGRFGLLGGNKFVLPQIGLGGMHLGQVLIQSLLQH